MTIQQKLLEVLKVIRDGTPIGSLGICGNVAEHFEEGTPERSQVDDILDDLIIKWKSPKDSLVFPVEGMGLHMVHKRNCTLWENPRRWELLHFMIAKLENE